VRSLRSWNVSFRCDEFVSRNFPESIAIAFEAGVNLVGPLCANSGKIVLRTRRRRRYGDRHAGQQFGINFYWLHMLPFAASRQLRLDFCPLIRMFARGYFCGGTVEDLRGPPNIISSILRNGVRRHV
jgi:hypothetical protein